jgi:DNA replication protein DnaC
VRTCDDGWQSLADGLIAAARARGIPPSLRPDPKARAATMAIDASGSDAVAAVPACPRCAGAQGWPETDHAGNDAWRECPCAAEQRRADQWNRIGVPVRLASATVAGFRVEAPGRPRKGDDEGCPPEPRDGRSDARAAALGCLRAIAAGERPEGVMLCGPPGRGKSHLLAAAAMAGTSPDIAARLTAIARDLAARHARETGGGWLTSALSRYVSCTDLAARVPASLDARDGQVSKWREEMAAVPLLALDEVGDMKPDSWMADLIKQVLHRRHDRRLVTFVATNYLPDDTGSESLARRVPPQILSRLRCLVSVVLTGDDWRTRGPA